MIGFRSVLTFIEKKKKSTDLTTVMGISGLKLFCYFLKTVVPDTGPAIYNVLHFLIHSRLFVTYTIFKILRGWVAWHNNLLDRKVWRETEARALVLFFGIIITHFSDSSSPSVYIHPKNIFRNWKIKYKPIVYYEAHLGVNNIDLPGAESCERMGANLLAGCNWWNIWVKCREQPSVWQRQK